MSFDPRHRTPHRNWRRIRVAAWAAVVVATVLTGTTGLAGAASSAPPRPNFYAVPDPLPKGRPGALIRVEELSSTDDARGWRVLYHSRAVDGRDIAVSGMVIAPTGRTRAARDIVTVGHGTTGLADGCAPSRYPGYEVDFATWPEYAPLLEAGYVITATDYEGLGVRGAHPYMVGESQGRAMLDAARAARQLTAANAGTRVVTLGDSQGGHASLFAATVAPDYAPELDLVGAVAVAPLLDPRQAVQLGTFPQAVGSVLMLVKGVTAAFPDVATRDVLTPDAEARLGMAAENMCSQGLTNMFLRPYSEVFVRNPVEDPRWSELLSRSIVPKDGIDVPVLVIKGDADQLLPRWMTDAFVTEACAAGTVIDYRVYPGAGHGDVGDAAQGDIGAWIRQRFDGGAIPSGCTHA